jgi:hypothetical protein
VRTRPGLIWDACGLLNLAATTHASEVLEALGCPSYVTAFVRTGEVFYLRSLPEEDPRQALRPVDLTPLLETGLLQAVELEVVEQATFVEFARDLDDGEAHTAAVAVHRRLHVVTDDRRALRALAALSPPVPVLTTPDWVKEWADTGAVAPDVLADTLRRIQISARFSPRRTHPLRNWWLDHLPRP